MQVHPLGQSLVLDADQSYTGTNPLGLNLEHTQQIGLSHVIPIPLHLVSSLVVLDDGFQILLALLIKCFVGECRLDFLESPQYGLAESSNGRFLIGGGGVELCFESPTGEQGCENTRAQVANDIVQVALMSSLVTLGQEPSIS